MPASPHNTLDESSAPETISVAVEQAHVDTQTRLTSRVRIDLRTETVTEAVNTTLSRTDVDVVRHEIGRTLQPDEAPPTTRTEGDTTVIPIFDEVVVVERRLRLVAELHLTPRTSSEDVTTDVVLRRQIATISRPSTLEDDGT